MPRQGSHGSIYRDGGPVEAAGYVAEVVADLIQIAHLHRLDVLCYLLDMARMEATELGRAQRRSRSSQE
ncbi:hypothetical protein LPW26_05345 [Rhodopseudomonas sp. HC1]|uniref:hypothetical protein n=1 Tax=Rhodopseudomonas infernalis TaxID=2897386 RepID=UPI001EE8B1F0|nr:hypothetical protein [Rhodopseudomonas infernalis]MCG6204051.1 hypothetical protein [Rhodopseudomonas infernalis]